MKNSEYYGVTDIYDYTVKVRKQREYPVRFESLVIDTTANGKYVDIDEYDVFSFTPSEDGVYLFKAENNGAGITGALYDDEMLDNCIAGKDENSETVTVRAVLTAGKTVYFKPARDNVYYSCDYKVSVTTSHSRQKKQELMCLHQKVNMIHGLYCTVIQLLKHRSRKMMTEAITLSSRSSMSLKKDRQFI